MLSIVGLLACASLTQAFSSVLTTNSNVLRYRVQTSLSDGGTVKPTPATVTPVQFFDEQLNLYSQVGSGPLSLVGAANSLTAYRTLDARDAASGSAATVNFHLLYAGAPVDVANSLCTIPNVPVSQLARRTISVGESVASTTSSGSCVPTSGLMQSCTVSQTTLGAKTISCSQTTDFTESAANDACPTTLTIAQRRLDSLCAPLRLRTAIIGAQSTYLNTLFRTTGDTMTLNRAGDYDLVAIVNGNENALTSFPLFENALSYEVTVSGTDASASAATEALYVGYVKILNAAHREFNTISGIVTTANSGSVSVAIETVAGALVDFVQALVPGTQSPSTEDRFLELPGAENATPIQYVAKFYDGRVARSNVYGTVPVTVTNPVTPTTPIGQTSQFQVVDGATFAPLYKLVVIQNTAPTTSTVTGTVLTLDTSAVSAGTTEHVINNQITGTGSSVRLITTDADSCDRLSSIATNTEFDYAFTTSSTSSRAVQLFDDASTCNGAQSVVFSSLSLDGDSVTPSACQRSYYFLVGRTYSLTTTTTNQVPGTCSGTFAGTCTTTRTLFGDLNFIGSSLTNVAVQNGPTVLRVVVPLCDCISIAPGCPIVNQCDVDAVLDAIIDNGLLVTSSIVPIVSSINGNVDAVKSKVDATKELVDSTKEAVYLVRNNLKKVDNDIENQVDDLKDDVNNIEDDIKDVDNKLTNVRDDVTHIRADAKAIRANQ